MKKNIHLKKRNSKNLFKERVGLLGYLAQYDHNEAMYILRALYHIVIKSGDMKKTKQELTDWVNFFEKESGISASFSKMPIETLLIELEDLQYVYPIRRHEIKFPIFD